jgi:hypothetical protein
LPSGTEEEKLGIRNKKRRSLSLGTKEEKFGFQDLMGRRLTIRSEEESLLIST